MGGEAGHETYVLTSEAVKACIADLKTRRIHPYFPAYLHLRQQASVQGSAMTIAPRWAELGGMLKVPGGPYGRPHFRPFWDTQRREAGQEWLNRNLAGSYAKSSLRSVPLKVVVANDDDTFGLREKHWELARLYLTHGEPVPAVSVAGFVFRNYGFVSDHEPSTDDLVGEFRATFGYSARDDDEFSHLYSTEWRGSDVTWFEIVDTATPGVLDG